jgi:putative heme-binding domain-containing protein
VFRISPIEPWREIRTRLRAKGIVPGIVEGGGRAAGYFTSATGVTIYDGDAWPKEFYGNAFIGDVGSNLVHRKLMERPPDSLAYVARRANNREFVASRDTWFRPVQFANGPDGNLYILDMYREVIEHPASLPPVLKKHLDLTSGRDRGRIYRVVRADAPPEILRDQLSRKFPGEASTEELVAMLAHKNGWHRTTAARLLYERNDAAIATALRASLRVDGGESARLAILYLLSDLDGLDLATLDEALSNSDPQVRAHAVRLARTRLAKLSNESNSEVEKLEYLVLARTMDQDLMVRFQTAFALGELRHPRIGALTTIVRRDGDNEYLRAAVFSSLARGSNQSLHQLLESDRTTASSTERRFLLELCRQIGARGDAKELATLAEEVASLHGAHPNFASDLLVAALQGSGSKRNVVREQLARASGGATDRILATVLSKALKMASSEEVPADVRSTAIGVLALGELPQSSDLLIELLTPRHPQEVQGAALAALGEFEREEAIQAIVDAWPGMSPALRTQAASVLLARAFSARTMLEAMEEGAISPHDLDPSALQLFKSHPDARLREQAAKLLQDGAPKRAEVVDAHLGVLQMSGDVARGREVFKKNCAICHRKENFGTEVGADLATVVTRTPEALLMSILDPNREVDPKYLQYTVLTVDGLAKSGMIAGETATSITLKREEGVTETVPRADIESIQSTGMTLMPEGLEKAIDKQSLADLIAYLRDQ